MWCDVEKHDPLIGQVLHKQYLDDKLLLVMGDMIDGAETCLVLILNTCIRFFFRSWGFSLQRENADFVQALTFFAPHQ